MNYLVLSSALIAIFAVIPTESAKILSVFSIPSPSHYIYGSALLKELAARGHEVTSVNVFPQKKTIPNFRDIFIEKNTHIISKFVDEVQDGSQQDSFWSTLNFFIEIVHNMCINIYEDSNFQQLLKNPKGKFDLVIMEVVLSDSLYGLGEHFGAPIIGVSTFGTMLGIDDVVGNISPNSVVTSQFAVAREMTFWNRVANMFTNLQTYMSEY